MHEFCHTRLLKQKSSYISSKVFFIIIDEWPSGPPHTHMKMGHRANQYTIKKKKNVTQDQPLNCNNEDGGQGLNPISFSQIYLNILDSQLNHLSYRHIEHIFYIFLEVFQ